jgi:predicted O-linked N-acetylglucosamine transferase (SPINDLY family)
MNQNEEQFLISQIYHLIQSNTNNELLLNDIVNKVETEYSYSYLLNYYIGLYYEKQGQMHLAEDYYNKSIQIKPLFSAPYFQYVDILINKNNFQKAEQLLKYIFNKKTLDPFSPVGAYSYNFMDNLRIVSVLIPKYMELKDYKKAEYYIKQILPNFKAVNKSNLVYRHLEIWKQIHISYAYIYTEKYFNMEKANEFYYLGLEGLCDYKHTQTLDIYDNLHKLDITLFQGYVMSSHYINKLSLNQLSFNVNDLFERYRVSDIIKIGYNNSNNSIKEISLNGTGTGTEKSNKIRIGYISPDFNKNAVGLFVTPLLKYYDKNRFEVFIYYKNSSFDEFTKVFQSYIEEDHWLNISGMENEELYNLMKYSHKLDVLVDLISLGTGSSMELFAKKPAQVIINYLGFPDISGLKEINYRIVDKITDPETKVVSQGETLIYMPKCFICYTLFENILMPKIQYNNETNNVYIGVMNKLTKHSDLIRKTWLEILKKKKSYILCLKIGHQDDINNVKELYKDFPKNQIKFMSFTNTLPEYFEQFNMFDFCVDTYPYSGTTTTCSSLLMGVPVFTIYHGSQGHHVSNVSASINIYSSQEQTNCKNLKEYKSKIMSYKVNKSIENDERMKRRELFLKCMDPKKFMEDYENMLNNII